jgi:type IV fimbrial biogenesis protein FimT
MSPYFKLHQVRGFTLIELMIVIALAAVLLSLAAPSFIGTLARKRMEGVAEVFGTDLQYARSEAVARNVEVRVTAVAANGCYIVYAKPGADTCTCTPTASCTAPATEIKTVSFAGTGTSVAANASFNFEPVRGMVADSTTPTVTFSNTGGPWQLTTTVTPVGRASTCSPSGSLKGYPTC